MRDKEERDRGSGSLDVDVREALGAGKVQEAATRVVRGLGAEVFGFLVVALGEASDADDVFANVSERVWRSLPGFRWDCSLRTWVYVIARREVGRYQARARRRNERHLSTPMLEDVAAVVRTATRSTFASEKELRVRALREQLSLDDRMLLVLRVDRALPWEDIARSFLDDTDAPAVDELRREAARLRKRFQLIKRRLSERIREEGLGG